jgi:hypothetical protein
MKKFGREPTINANDSQEKRMAEAIVYLRNLKNK